MASITLNFSDNEVARVKAIALYNGMTNAEIANKIKDICYTRIEDALKQQELSMAKNTAIQNFHDEFIPLERS